MKTQKDYNWIIRESNIPFLKLDMEVPVEKILQEILKVKESATGQSGNAAWKGAVLHGLSTDKPRPAKFYGYSNEDEAPYVWTDVVEKTPFTKKWIEDTLPYSRLYRVKMNLLEPGGEIGPHVDSKKSILGVSDLTSPEHVTYVTFAIEWPKEVIFNVGNYRMPIQTGDVYLVNFSNLHEVYNKTDKDRYSIIVMAKFDDSEEWRKLVEKSYLKYGDEYLNNKSSISFLLKSKFYYRPKYLLNRILFKVSKVD